MILCYSLYRKGTNEVSTNGVTDGNSNSYDNNNNDNDNNNDSNSNSNSNSSRSSNNKVISERDKWGQH